MTGAQKGNYRAKHPEETKVSDALHQAVAHKITAGRISCQAALAIARRLKVAPLEVGKAIDLQEVRIEACQLGLFGYGAEKHGPQEARRILAGLEAAIRQALVHGRLSCVDAWSIADAHRVARIDVARTCETLRIKICQCQLGAF